MCLLKVFSHHKTDKIFALKFELLLIMSQAVEIIIGLRMR